MQLAAGSGCTKFCAPRRRKLVAEDRASKNQIRSILAKTWPRTTACDSGQKNAYRRHGHGEMGDLSRPQNLYALGGITLEARPGQDHASALFWGPQMDSERKVKLHAVTWEVRTKESQQPTGEKAWGGAEVVKGESLLNI